MNDIAAAPRSRGYVIAVQPDVLTEEPFSARLVERLTELGHEARLVSVRDPDFITRVRECDGFLWWFPPLSGYKELGRSVLSALDHVTDLVVHPDWRSCWHFDDKAAQMSLLQAAGISMPATRVFWSYSEATEFLRTAEYPLVLKLSSGYRAENVALLRNRAHAERMATRLFGRGVSSLHPRRYEALRVVARPLRNWLRRLCGLAPVAPPVLQRGSMLVQEFIRAESDTRVTIIGDRAFVWRRGNRPNDFRASGYGNNDYEPSRGDEDVIRLVWRAARTLRMLSMSADVIRRAGEPLILEISYFFEPHLIRLCPGHWRLGEELEWVTGSMHAADAVVDELLLRMQRSRRDRL